MAFANNCWVTAGSSGTADFSDGTAVTGNRDFTTALTDGELYYYRAETQDRSEWETGSGIYTTTGDKIARTTIYESSNAGAKVTFSEAPLVSVQFLAQSLATVAQIEAKTADVILGLKALWTAAETYDFGNWTGTPTPDLSNVLASAKATMTGNVTLGATSNTKVGHSFILELTQDGTGTRTLALNSTYWVTSEGAALDIDTTGGAKNVYACTTLDGGKILIGLAGKAVA